MNDRLISVIIPVYNEEKAVGDCLKSLDGQSYKPIEIIVVDDGSTDKTLDIVKNCQLSIARLASRAKRINYQLFQQKHLGPGPARNFGAKHAKGEILVFVDADMTFEKNFIKDLVKPILAGQTIGTFSKNEMVANPDNIWAICWNINRNVPKDLMLPKDYPNEAPVFRAIAKKEFAKVGGFDTSGEYTDDWSLSRKLGIKSTLARGAIYYHSNPSTLKEVWKQARWIGKNEFISGWLLRKIRSLFVYSLPVSILVGIFKSIVKGQLSFIVFKLTYDLAIWISTVKSFTKEAKFK